MHCLKFILFVWAAFAQLGEECLAFSDKDSCEKYSSEELINCEHYVNVVCEFINGSCAVSGGIGGRDFGDTDDCSSYHSEVECDCVSYCEYVSGLCVNGPGDGPGPVDPGPGDGDDECSGFSDEDSCEQYFSSELINCSSFISTRCEYVNDHCVAVYDQGGFDNQDACPSYHSEVECRCISYCEWVDGICSDGNLPPAPEPEPDNNGSKCGTISISNYLECCFLSPGNEDKCWLFTCGTIDNNNYEGCCQDANALSGGCPAHCNSVTAVNNISCCSGSNPASGCFAFLCGAVTQSNYGTCCGGAQTASGCTSACIGDNILSGCPPPSCVPVDESNFGTCCSSGNQVSGCLSFRCATGANIDTTNYGECCGGVAKGAGCDEYCETNNHAAPCPVNPCSVVNGNNYGACCSQSSAACSSYCTSNPSSDVCKTSGSLVMSIHMAGLLLVLCFLLAAF